MKAEIESIVCNWTDKIPHSLVRVINAIVLSANKDELKDAINKISEDTKLDKFFAYGRTHFGLTHRRLSNGESMERRLLIVKF